MNTKDLAELVLNRLERIEQKLDSVHRHANQIDVTLAGQAKDIAHHIKRTDLLEKKLESMHPLVLGAKGIAWAVGFIGLILGIAVAWSTLS